MEARSMVKGKGTWFQRGWTYQKSMLSRQMLIFDDDCVWWDCGCGRFSEDHGPYPKHVNCGQIVNQNSCLASPFPILRDYKGIVKDYSDRESTHPQDAMDVYASILIALSNTFYGGFIYGIPAMWLEIGLC